MCVCACVFVCVCVCVCVCVVSVCVWCVCVCLCVCRVTELFAFVLEIIPTSVSIEFINCYSRILTVCFKNLNIYILLPKRQTKFVYTTSYFYHYAILCTLCIVTAASGL